MKSLVLALALVTTGPPFAGPTPTAPRAHGAAEDAAAELEARVDALRERGADGALAALDGFAERPLDERRALSVVVRDVGDERAIPAALAVLDDPDELVRRNLITLLARPDQPSVEERADALFERARTDVVGSLRRMAILGLTSIGGDAAVTRLERGVRELEPEDRRAAAVALASLPAARERVVELVQQSFAEGASRPAARLSTDVLATLLDAYGQRLAETGAGGTASADRAPFVLGRSHPAADVRSAAEGALSRFVGTLRYLGRGERAEVALGALIDEGLDPTDLWRRRAQLALDGDVDLELARRAAIEIRRLAAHPHEADRLFWLWRADLLAAATELLDDRPSAAATPLERARGTCEALLGLGYESLPPNRELLLERELLSTRPEAYERLALVEVFEIVRLVATGRGAGDRQVLEHARSAHVALLRAQLAARRSFQDMPYTWDRVLNEDRLSPLVLFGSGRTVGALTTERALALARTTCRAAAAVSARELIGFAPIPGIAPSLADPLDDPERIALLDDIQSVELRMVERKIASVRLEKQAAELAGRERTPQLDDQLRLLRDRQRRLSRERGSVEDGLPRMRPPARAGLRLAELLRVDGRSEEALELARELRRDYDALDVFPDLPTLLLSSRIDSALGAALTDLGRADEADQVMSEAVARLEELEAELQTRGFGADQVQTVRETRMNVLVSLAVNANVKQRRPDLALEYFERAYAIRQDDFMRVLLGCYRARAGLEDEARRAIRDVIPSPSTYYNLACTHALLGDTDLALDYLQRDFAENHASPSSLEHQQEWARDDPDLEGLAGDPRFERLLELPFGELGP